MVCPTAGRPTRVTAPQIPPWSKISNALKRLGFRSQNFLAQPLFETSRAYTIRFDDQGQRGSGMIWARILAYITGWPPLRRCSTSMLGVWATAMVARFTEGRMIYS
jgi:hypothetical protein